MSFKPAVRLFLLGSFLLFVHCQNHGHSHDHHGHAHDHHGHAHDHHHGHQHDEPPSFKYSKQANTPHEKAPQAEDKKPIHHGEKEEFDVWLTALTSTAVISIAPVFILFLIPLDKSPSYENLLKVLLSFASGGLLGDAFLHLIPHALMAQQALSDDRHSHSHGHSHEHGHSHDMSVGLWILSGIVAFLAVEKVGEERG